MSQVALSGNASGTGTFTIASPNSNTDRTLTLPDATGTLLASGGAISGTTGTFSGAVSGTTGSFPSGVSVGPSITFGDATVQTTAAGAPTTTQVLNATAGATAGGVGTYAFLRNSIGGSNVFGGTAAGGVLQAVSLSTDGGSIDGGFVGASMSGTWRAMSYPQTSPYAYPMGLYLRIS
jgi:hypothetical protein